MRRKAATLLLFASACLALPGCSSTHHSKYLNRDVQSIAVLPPVSEVGVDYAPRVMLPFVVKHVRGRGFRVPPEEELQQYFKAQGIGSGDLASIPPEEIAQGLGVDGVISSTITRWGKVFATLGTMDGVSAAFELHDKNGSLLWSYGWLATKNRRPTSSGANLDPRRAKELCETVCIQAFRRLKLPGYDPSRPKD